MPCFSVKFNHSAMPKDYVGKAIKFAPTPKDAAECIGKYSKKDRTILDKRGNLLSNVEINEEES